MLKEVFNWAGILGERFALVVLVIVYFTEGSSIFDSATNTLIMVAIWLILAKDMKEYE